MPFSDCNDKADVLKKYQLQEGDTGSPEVQIAVLTHRLEVLSEHFKGHPLDKHSRRGLLKIVAKRKNLLNYLKGKDVRRYRATLERFSLRK